MSGMNRQMVTASAAVTVACCLSAAVTMPVQSGYVERFITANALTIQSQNLTPAEVGQADLIEVSLAVTHEEGVIATLRSSPVYMRLLKLRAPADMVSADGAVGRNQSSFSDVAAQRDVLWLTMRGLAEDNKALLDASMRALEYAFRHQTREGNFRNGRGVSAVKAVGVDAFFIQAYARIQLFISASPYSREFAPRFAALRPKLGRALTWLRNNRNELYRQDRYATNRLFFDGIAFGLGAQLTGDAASSAIAEEFIKAALANQSADGSFNEHHGYDSSYQAVSILNMGALMTHLDNQQIIDRLQSPFDRAVAWQRTRIKQSGEVVVTGNTRTGLGQETFLGKEKEVNYPEVALSLLYVSYLRQDPSALALGERVIKYALSRM
jgi:hypothetical protein